MTNPLRHVVLFTFRPDLDADKISEAVGKFSALAREIDVVRQFEWGENVSPEGLGQGYTHCFFLSFDDAAARDEYLNHPAHQIFVAYVQPLLAQALVVDFSDQGA